MINNLTKSTVPSPPRYNGGGKSKRFIPNFLKILLNLITTPLLDAQASPSIYQ